MQALAEFVECISVIELAMRLLFIINIGTYLYLLTANKLQQLAQSSVIKEYA